MNAWLLWLLALPLAGENRLWWGELEVERGVERVRVESAAGSTVWDGDVAAVVERVPVPVAARAPGDLVEHLPAAPGQVVADGGTASFAGWSERDPADDWKRVSPALRARSRAVLAGAVRAPSLAALAWVVGALVLVAGARGRAALQLAVAVVAAAVAGFLPAPEGVRTVSVWEGDGAESRVLVVRGRDAAPFGPDDLRLEVEPERRPIDFAAGSPAWEARSPGAILTLWRPAPPLSLNRGRNDHRDLAEVWVRDVAGAWSALGPWGTGAPLPTSGRPGTPPGWLAAGLPPGREVLVARIVGDAARWIRWVGFP